MNEKLQFIREKCIAANPDKIWEVAYDDIYRRIEPCRLGDVLLAFQGQGIATKMAIDENGYFYLFAGGSFGREDECSWNLRADDLEKQPEETISFLYDLLR
jgi:hypothetical protein